MLTRNAKIEQQARDDENLTVERPTFVTHLECSMTGERYPADELHNLSRAGKPLLVRYDLAGVKKSLSREALAQRPHDLWRYRELLPVRRIEDIVSLGEAVTPIVAMPKLAKMLATTEILVKDESRLPTGSFKARGLALAVSMAKALGVAHMAMPTNGNAGAALAAYASRAGIKTTVFCPQDTPEVNVREIALQGATVYRVNVPDVVLYPTGGGTGLIGMWKAFAELEAIGFIGKKRPRMVAVQAAGCAPIVRAYDAGAEHAPRWEDAQTIAAGIRVPQAIGDFLVLRAVRESAGFAIAVADAAISAAIDEVARAEGLLLCPEGAATYAALKQGIADGRIRRDERALLFNCATGLKYPMPPVDRTLDRLQPIDFAAL